MTAPGAFITDRINPNNAITDISKEEDLQSSTNYQS